MPKKSGMMSPKEAISELDRISNQLLSNRLTELQKENLIGVYKYGMLRYVNEQLQSNSIPAKEKRKLNDKLNSLNQKITDYQLDKVSKILSSTEATPQAKEKQLDIYRRELLPAANAHLASKTTSGKTKKQFSDKLNLIDQKATAFELDKISNKLSSNASLKEKENHVQFFNNKLRPYVIEMLKSDSTPGKTKKELGAKLKLIHQKELAFEMDKIIEKLASKEVTPEEKRRQLEIYREKIRPFVKKQLRSSPISEETKSELQSKLGQLDAISPSSIKKLDYFSNERGTKASRLDQAWANYKNNALPMDERRKALDYMIYIFDIKKFSGDKEYLNKVLDTLMEKRERVKETRPDYIPMLLKGNYKLRSDGRELPATDQTKVSEYTDIQRAFDDGELLDVNPKDKVEDREKQFFTYLSPDQKEEFGIEIYDGKFHKDGQVFDSSELEAHGKPGYVAFTLNVDGELSAFQHMGPDMDEQGRRLGHSSMNAGAPVLAAGEMEIKNGKLISLNTYSGHYEPSLYSVARFLEYLSDRGVDISEAKVYIHEAPNERTGLNAKEVYIERPFQVRSATVS